MEYACRNCFAHGRWKGTKQASCQEKLLRHIYCTRWPLWRKSTYLDGYLHPLSSGRELIQWMCSHGSFGLSVILVPCWMRRHMFVFLVCIIKYYFDASFHCEQIGNPCLLDDTYVYWGCTWDFQDFHLHNLDIIHDVIAIIHSTFHDGALCMMLMMLRRMHTG